MRLTLIPVRDSWYSMHCLRRMPSLKASKEWCSMNDMPSICMLLTFAPNSTRLFSLPLTMGRRYGRSILTMRCFTSLPKNRSDCWRYTARTAHNRFSCSVDRQMQGLYNLRRWSHWKMSLERSFRSLRLSFLVEAAGCLRCLAYASLALATSLYLLLGTRSDKILLSQESKSCIHSQLSQSSLMSVGKRR